MSVIPKEKQKSGALARSVRSLLGVRSTLPGNASQTAITTPQNGMSPARIGAWDVQDDQSSAPKSGGNGLFGSFLFLAALPAFLAAFYYLFFATDQFVTETRFAVQSSQDLRQDTLDATAFLTKIGVPKTSKSTIQEGYMVLEFIKSRNIIESIGGKSVLESKFSKSEIDWFARLNASESTEKIWKYWQSMVSTIINTQSGIITVKVRAFSRQDSLDISRKIVKSSEDLVNKISIRNRSDALQRAEREIKDTGDRLEAARLALFEFRTQNRSIDPLTNAGSIGELIAKLTMEKIDAENNLAIAGSSLNANSPTQRISTAKIDAINQQIEQLRRQLTSSERDNASLANQLSKYEDIQLNVKFSEKLHSIAQNFYEKSRYELEKQQLYIVEIVKPTEPEYALYPKALFNTFLVFLTGFIFWGLSALVVAGIRDHMT